MRSHTGHTTRNIYVKCACTMQDTLPTEIEGVARILHEGSGKANTVTHITPREEALQANSTYGYKQRHLNTLMLMNHRGSTLWHTLAGPVECNAGVGKGEGRCWKALLIKCPGVCIRVHIPRLPVTLRMLSSLLEELPPIVSQGVHVGDSDCLP